jgi:hypothetical protein
MRMKAREVTSIGGGPVAIPMTKEKECIDECYAANVY